MGVSHLLRGVCGVAGHCMVIISNSLLDCGGGLEWYRNSGRQSPWVWAGAHSMGTTSTFFVPDWPVNKTIAIYLYYGMLVKTPYTYCGLCRNKINTVAHLETKVGLI